MTVSETKPTRRRSIVRHFLANSTIDGLKSIAEAYGPRATVFWCIAFLACLSVLLFFGTLKTKEYFEYHSKIDLGFLSDHRSTFPAFTICNSADLRSDRLNGPFIDYLYNRSLITSKNYSQTLAPELDSEVFAFLLLLINDRGASQEELAVFTYSLDAMLLSCSYNGETCNQSDFVWFFSNTYGSCYTFNAKRANQTKDELRKTTKNGGRGELNIQLYLHTQLYAGPLSGTSGMVAMVSGTTGG